jgi:hypothetical protein
MSDLHGWGIACAVIGFLMGWAPFMIDEMYKAHCFGEDNRTKEVKKRVKKCNKYASLFGLALSLAGVIIASLPC